MERIYDYKSLLLLKSKYEDTILMRKNQPTNSPNIVENEKHIMVCGGTGCKASNSDKIIDALNSAIEEKNLKQKRKSSYDWLFWILCSRTNCSNIA